MCCDLNTQTKMSLRYDEEFNVVSKAEYDQLNLSHVYRNEKV